MFIVRNDLCLEITSNIFIEGAHCCHNLHYTKDFRTILLKSFYHGTENAAYIRLKMWGIVPEEIKNFK